MNSQYNVFLMIELAKEKGIIDKELEYDLMWETGCGLIKEFTDSKFDRITCDLYDCISEFLDDKKSINRVKTLALEFIANHIQQLDANDELYQATDMRFETQKIRLELYDILTKNGYGIDADTHKLIKL